MKKIIAFVLCILMLVSCFVFTTSAEEEEYQDISQESLLKCSTQWNYYSGPKYTIDGKIYEAVRPGGYEFWRSDYSRNPAYDPNDVWIEYRYREYKEIDTITLYVSRYSKNEQEKYFFKALVMGEWIEFPAFTTDGYPNYVYTDSKGNETEFPTVAVVTLDISEMVKKLKTANPGKYDHIDDGNLVTKKFRFYLQYTDQWSPPLFFETVIMGKKGNPPALDVPDDAEVSTNAALSGHAYASSSSSNHYPALAFDNVVSAATPSFWQSATTTNGEWVKSEFDKPYNISAVNLDFGALAEENDNLSYTVTVDLLGADNTWSKLATKDVKTTKDVKAGVVNFFTAADESEYLKDIRGIRVTFDQMNGKQAVISEINATIAGGGKCIFLAGWMTGDRKMSLANGNAAIYGTPYCSSAFDHIGISEVSYINDGQISDGAPCWYAGTMGTGEYCGVTLALPEGQKANVTKVVLNFTDYITWDYYNMITQVRENAIKDDYVLGFDVQAKQADGTYKTVASGTSYDKTSKSYIVAFDFTDLVTDDIRVVFTSNDAGFAYLKEIEIFASDISYTDATHSGYCTFPTLRKPTKASTDFGTPHVVFRAPFMDIISPLASK